MRLEADIDRESNPGRDSKSTAVDDSASAIANRGREIYRISAREMEVADDQAASYVATMAKIHNAHPVCLRGPVPGGFSMPLAP